MLELLENHSLRSFNTFGLDIKSEYFTRFTSVDELRESMAWKLSKCKDFMILGGGSNVLFTEDFEGLVLRNELFGIQVIGETETFIQVEVGAGEVWHDFVMKCIQNDWAGLENLSLIPGSVGASPMQNIGAYGVEIEQRFHSLKALHLETLEIHEFSHDDCAFGYRESVFKNKLKGQYCILSVTFNMLKTPDFQISYGAIKAELESAGSELSIKSISDAVIRIRRSKLPDPNVIGNAGSFFKNPVVNMESFEKVKAAHPDIVAYPAGNKMKIAAGWMIDQAGWKGEDRGGYGVHDKQALVLVNRGGATGESIYNLSSDIIRDIQEKYGVTLEREVNVIRTSHKG